MKGEPRVPFNRPAITGKEGEYMAQAMQGPSLAGDGHFAEMCHEWFKKNLGGSTSLLVPSCTHAMELAALLLDIEPGDEVIMPSFTYVSTATAFALRGARVVFVDIRPDTMNLDEKKIESKITKRTRVIVPVHYGGVGCEMTRIQEIAKKHGLYVVEDAAHAMMARYQSRPLGTLGHFGAFSFHDSKNYTAGGEGGLIIINEPRFIERAEIIREKGTDRSQFFRGKVEKYQWKDIGSSYVMSEIQAAFLWAQLEQAKQMLEKRLASWAIYAQRLKHLNDRGLIELPVIPEDCEHNGHLFFVKAASVDVRDKLISALAKQGCEAAFHYVPLHTSVAGRRFGRFHGKDNFTTKESGRLLRLPMFHGITEQQQDMVVKAVKSFYG